MEAEPYPYEKELVVNWPSILDSVDISSAIELARIQRPQPSEVELLALSSSSTMSNDDRQFLHRHLLQLQYNKTLLRDHSFLRRFDVAQDEENGHAIQWQRNYQSW